MIEFEGSNYTFEVFSYVFDEICINMGRIHFGHSSIGIDYIEGNLFETDSEFVESALGVELEPIITCMRIISIHKIRFKDGTEFIAKDMENARQCLAVPPLDPHNYL